mmetsp:Transcript_22782/g.32135  ORF Transcript_22782/g.32135 Transcript_22782/m.32135 type:complete len:509 (+) Transcript_22782:80-1606(+)
MTAKNEPTSLSTPLVRTKIKDEFVQKNPVDQDLLSKAVYALKKFHADTISKQSSETNTTPLFAKDVPVQVQITLSRVPQDPSSRPIRIQIPHPLHKLNDGLDEEIMNDDDDDEGEGEEPEICLIVKDSVKEYVKDIKTKFPKELSPIKKILTLTSLRQKHSTYADRRKLLQMYNLFLADDRILPMLGKSLGKAFFAAKKQPVPIKITNTEALPITIDRCLRSTFMVLNPGTCITIRAGHTGMSDKKVCENIQAVSANAALKVPRKWSNIASISIKTPTSISLPVYNKTREELEEIAQMAEGNRRTIALGDNDGTNGSGIIDKKRSIVENHNQEEKEKLEQKSKKQKVLGNSKSPLLKALQQKQKIEEEKAQLSSKSSKKNITEKNVGKKKRKKSESSNGEADIKPSLKKEKSKKKEMKSKEGKEKLSENSKVVEKIESLEFIASKRFKGAKNGYVFAKRKEGLGYYKDAPPAVDQMVIEAIRKMAHTTNNNSGGRGKGKGRRQSRGRR